MPQVWRSRNCALGHTAASKETRPIGYARIGERTGGLIMFGTMEPWGYGGYGQFHMVVWIILVIVAVAGIVWRLR